MKSIYKSEVLGILINHKAKSFFKKHPLLESLFKEALKASFETKTLYADIIKLKGASDLYRLRLGAYRVVFSKSKAGQITILTALMADNRGDIY